MSMIKSCLTGKGRRFIVSLIAAALCLAAAIVYQATYRGDQYYAPGVFICLLMAAPVAALMIALKIDGFLPTALCVISGLAAAMFIYAMYWDVSVVLVGIDKTAFEARFIACGAMLLAAFAASEVSLYAKTRGAK